MIVNSGEVFTVYGNVYVKIEKMINDSIICVAKVHSSFMRIIITDSNIEISNYIQKYHDWSYMNEEIDDFTIVTISEGDEIIGIFNKNNSIQRALGIVIEKPVDLFLSEGDSASDLVKKIKKGENLPIRGISLPARGGKILKS